MNRRQISQHIGESGSALVMVLGMISLVLMIGVAYLYSSSNAKKVSKAMTGEALDNSETAQQLVMRCFDSYFKDATNNYATFVNPPEDPTRPSSWRGVKFSSEYLNNLGSSSTRDEINGAHVRFAYSQRSENDNNPSPIDIFKNNYMVKMLDEAKMPNGRFYFERTDNIPGANDKSIFEEFGYNLVYRGEERDDSLKQPAKKRFTRYAYMIFDDTGKVDLNQIIPLRAEQPLIKAGHSKAEMGRHKVVTEATTPVFTNELVNSTSGATMPGYAYADYFYNVTGTLNANDERVGNASYSVVGDGYNLTAAPQTVRLGTNLQEIRCPVYWRDVMKNETEIAGTAGTQKVKEPWTSFGRACRAVRNMNLYNDELLRQTLTYRIHSATIMDKLLVYNDNVPNPTNYAAVDYAVNQCRHGDRLDITGFEWWDFVNPEDNPLAPIVGNTSYTFSKTNNGWNLWEKTDSAEGLYHFLDKMHRDGYDVGKDLPDAIYRAYEMSASGSVKSGARKFFDWLAKPEQKPVAYNIKDYCDADNYATWDYDHLRPLVNNECGASVEWALALKNLGNLLNADDSWLYVGRERVPYINEIDFDFDLIIRDCTPVYEDDAGNMFRDVEYTLRIRPKVELVNIYEVATPNDMQVAFYFDGEMYMNAGPNNSISQVFSSTDINPVYGQPIGTAQFKNPNPVPSNPNYVNDQYIYPGNVLVIPVTPFGQTSYGVAALEPNNCYVMEGRIPVQVYSRTDLANITASLSVDNAVAVLFDGNKSPEMFFPPMTADVKEHADLDFLYDLKVVRGKDTIGSLQYENVCNCDENGPGLGFEPANWDGSGFPLLYASDGPLSNLQSWQIADPRCSGGTIANLWCAAAPTPYRDNTNFEPTSGAGKDRETHVTFYGSNPVTYSTAFVRNRPFESIWELGSIHTGKIDNTINLCAPVEGGESFYDWLKIGPQNVFRGLMNPNADNDAMFQQLFKGMNLNDGYVLNPSNYNSASQVKLDPTKDFLPTDANTVFEALNQRLPLYLYNVGGTYRGWNDLTDRQREGIMARIAPFVSTRYEYFTVLLYAEDLQENNNGDGAGNLQGYQKDFAFKTTNNGKFVEVLDDSSATEGGTSVTRLCKVADRHLIEAHVVCDRKKRTVEILSFEEIPLEE